MKAKYTILSFLLMFFVFSLFGCFNSEENKDNKYNLKDSSIKTIASELKSFKRTTELKESYIADIEKGNISKPKIENSYYEFSFKNSLDEEIEVNTSTLKRKYFFELKIQQDLETDQKPYVVYPAFVWEKENKEIYEISVLTDNLKNNPNLENASMSGLTPLDLEGKNRVIEIHIPRNMEIKDNEELINVK